MPPLFLPCCLMDIDGWTMNDDEKNIYILEHISQKPISNELSPETKGYT